MGQTLSTSWYRFGGALASQGKLLLCLGLLFSVWRDAPASVVARLTFDELSRGAERIAHARCVRTSAYFDPESQMIWTRNDFEVIEILKGQVDPEIIVTEPGGVIAGMGQVVPGAPQFSPGDEVVLFLARTVTGKWRVRGWGQGNYRVKPDPESGEPTVKADISGIELAEAPTTAGPELSGYAVTRTGRESLKQFKQRIRDQLLRQSVRRN